MEGKCRNESITYKYIVSTSGHPDNAYLGTAEGDFKKRYYNHISSFQNKTQMNKTTLAKYFWELKQKHNITLILKCYIVRSVPSYFNIIKSCMLWLHEKLTPKLYTRTTQTKMSYWTKYQNLFLNAVILTSIYYLIVKLSLTFGLIPFNNTDDRIIA